MRKKLLLKEFVAARSFGDIQKLVEESLRLLKEDKMLFESVHDQATDETYKIHALKTVGKLKIEADRHSETRENNMKSLILALKGIRDYFAARQTDADFVSLLSINIDNAEKDVASGGTQGFEPKFTPGTNPEEERKFKAHFLSAATATPGLFPRMATA